MWSILYCAVVAFCVTSVEQRATILCALWAHDNCFTKIVDPKKFASIENFTHLGGANNIVLLGKNNNDDNANT
jgi:hypothetical protein